MFHVFGLGGRLVSGGPDTVRQVASVRGVARVRPLAHSGLAADGEDHVSLSPGAGQQPAHQPSALAAYASVQQQLQGEARQALTRVAQVMSPSVFSLQASQTLDEAWQGLVANDVSQAPVLSAAVPGLAPRLVGLLRRADLLQPSHWPAPAAPAADWQAHARQFWRQTVADWMITPIAAVSPEADLRRVAAVLLQWRLPGLPVVDEAGALCGFVSRSDVLKAVVADPPLDLWG